MVNFSIAFFEDFVPLAKKCIPGFNETRFIHLVFDTMWPERSDREKLDHVNKTINSFLPASPWHACMILAHLSACCENAQFEEKYAFSLNAHMPDAYLGMHIGASMLIDSPLEVTNH